MLIVCYGLPGTGKTTLGRALAESLGGTLLSTDAIRKRIVPQPSYTFEERELVYRVIFLMIEFSLQHLEHVLLDGTFTESKLRQQVVELAERLGTELRFVECVCDERTALERISNRTNSLSDADAETYRHLRGIWEPDPRPHVVVDTALPVARNVEIIRRELFGRTG